MAELTSEAAMLQMLHGSTADDVTSGDDWTTVGVSLVLNATASLSSSIATGGGGDLTTMAAETMRGLLSTTTTTMATTTRAAPQSTHPTTTTTTTIPTSTSSRPLLSSLSTYFADVAAKTVATKQSMTSHMTSPASTSLSSSVSNSNINVANTATTLFEKVMNAITKTTSSPKTLPHQHRPALGELLVVDEFNPWWSIRHDESVAMIIFAVVVMMVVVVVIILAHVVLRSRQGYERLSNNGDHLIVPVTPPHRYETVCRPRPEEEPDEGPRDGGFVGVTVPLVQEVTRI